MLMLLLTTKPDPTSITLLQFSRQRTREVTWNKYTDNLLESNYSIPERQVLIA